MLSHLKLTESVRKHRVPPSPPSVSLTSVLQMLGSVCALCKWWVRSGARGLNQAKIRMLPLLSCTFPDSHLKGEESSKYWSTTFCLAPILHCLDKKKPKAHQWSWHVGKFSTNVWKCKRNVALHSSWNQPTFNLFKGPLLCDSRF